MTGATLLVADAQGLFGCARQGGANGGLGSLLPFASIAVLFWFMLLRPQQKRERERLALLKSLKKGDMVVTTAGIVGRIGGLTDATVLLDVNDKVRLTVLRTHVTGLYNEAAAASGATKDNGRAVVSATEISSATSEGK